MSNTQSIQNTYQPFYKINPDSLLNPWGTSFADSFMNSIIGHSSPINGPFEYYDKEFSSVKTKKEVIRATGLSERFINKIIDTEGFENKEYLDAAGLRTIGVGHNIEADSTYHHEKNATIPDEEVYRYLAKDLNEAKQKLKKLTNNKEFSKNQHEALVDLFFNVKTETIEKSNFLKLLKNGNYKQAIKEMDFVLAGENVSTALCLRRMNNINDFCGGKHFTESIDAMKNILEKAEASIEKQLKNYDKKIEKAGFNLLKKAYIETQKVYFEAQSTLFRKEAQRILDSAQKSMVKNKK